MHVRQWQLKRAATLARPPHRPRPSRPPRFAQPTSGLRAALWRSPQHISSDTQSLESTLCLSSEAWKLAEPLFKWSVSWTGNGSFKGTLNLVLKFPIKRPNALQLIFAVPCALLKALHVLRSLPNRSSLKPIARPPHHLHGHKLEQAVSHLHYLEHAEIG